MSTCKECGGGLPPPKPMGTKTLTYCSDECDHKARNDRNRPKALKRIRTAEYKAVQQEKKIKRRTVLSMVKTTAGCTDCGYDKEACALDFDHTSNNKSGNVSQLAYYSWKKLYEEIMKCDVVCAICHRIRTHKRQEREW